MGTWKPVGILALCCACLSHADRTQADDSKSPKKASSILPGVQPDGRTLLPNQWSLRPAGKQLELGDFPVNIALHPSGKWLAALHSGWGENGITIVNLVGPKILCRVTIDQAFYGLCFSPDGRRLFASGGELEVVHSFDFDDGFVSRHRQF